MHDCVATELKRTPPQLCMSSHLYTPGADWGPMKLFSRSRRTSFSIRTWAGSRSLGSFAGRIISDWKKAARSLREVAACSKAGDITLLSGDKDTAEWLVADVWNKRGGAAAKL